MADARETVHAHIETEIRRLQEKIEGAEGRVGEHRVAAEGAVADAKRFRRLVSMWTAAITRISVPPHQACDAEAESGDEKVPHDEVRRPGVPTPLACVFKSCPDPSRCGLECRVPAGSYAAHCLVSRTVSDR